MDKITKDVILQPYAGKLKIIKDLPVPEPPKNVLTKHRPSYFNRTLILQTLIKCLAELEMQPNMATDEVVNGILSALETFMIFNLKIIIELCEHRTNYRLLRDPRCVFNNDARSTMMFLNEVEMATYESSDDSSDFYCYGRKRRRQLRKSRHRLHRFQAANRRRDEKERMAAINYTAFLALGGRKRKLGVDPTEKLQIRPPPLRFKHIKIKDVTAFMENDKRFRDSFILYEAYIIYKT